MEEGDLDTVIKIQGMCYSEVAPESRQSFLSKLVVSPETCVVAEDAGNVVGYLVSVPIEFSEPPTLNAENVRVPPAPDCLYLHDLAITPTYRSRGVGRLLVDAFFEAAHRRNLPQVSLIAVQNSSPYWARYGFTAVSVSASLAEKIAGYGEKAVLMSSLLASRSDTVLPQ